MFDEEESLSLPSFATSAQVPDKVRRPRYNSESAATSKLSKSHEEELIQDGPSSLVAGNEEAEVLSLRQQLQNSYDDPPRSIYSRPPGQGLVAIRYQDEAVTDPYSR